MQGMIFNIQRYSIHDGPGIRTTVFLKACPLNCWWCHNPESQSPDREVIYYEDRCIGCGTCVRCCPEGALKLIHEEKQSGQTKEIQQNREIDIDKHKHYGQTCSGEENCKNQQDRQRKRVVRDKNKCELCGICIENCPAGAMEMIGQVMTTGEIIEAVEKDIIFYDQSGGGVTLSGGEPLSQFELVRELVDYFHQTGINIAIDTSGYTPWYRLKEIASQVDLFLYDLKFIDSEKHRKYTGKGNERILDNLIKLANRESCKNEQSKSNYQILGRIPLIPGINDDKDNIEGIGRFFKKQQVKQVNILPYHNTGLDKYSRLEREYKLHYLESLSQKRVDFLAGLLRRLGLEVKIGG